jgi:hypothetical protein
MVQSVNTASVLSICGYSAGTRDSGAESGGNVEKPRRLGCRVEARWITDRGSRLAHPERPRDGHLPLLGHRPWCRYRCANVVNDTAAHPRHLDTSG